MLNDLLIDRLSADLRPVRRRSPMREGMLVVALGVAELVFVLAAGFARPGLGSAMGLPFMWWKLGGLAAIAAVATVSAIRSFTPTIVPRRGITTAAGLAIVVAVAGVAVKVGPPMGTTLAERLYPAHGLICALAIVTLSLPMAALLSVLMRRAASTNPHVSALAVGTAAGSWGAFVFAFCCPMNDPLYVAVWYAVACTAVAGGARLVLPRRHRL